MKINNKITQIVTHSNCPDGKASALILKQVFPDAAVTFLKHNSKEHLELKAVPGILFCDFSPPKDRIKEFVDVGTYVLDHHKHQKDIVEAFGERGVYADEYTEPGVSGAVLAYREVFCNSCARQSDQLKDFAILTGIRDCWVKSSPRWLEACEQAAALHFFSEDYLLANGFSEKESYLGKYLYEQSLCKAKETAQNKVILVDRIAIACGIETSDAADYAFDLYDIDVFVGFQHFIENEKLMLRISMRSRNGGVDVGAIAKANGGGGHSGAAGFVISALNESVIDDIVIRLQSQRNQ